MPDAALRVLTERVVPGMILVEYQAWMRHQRGWSDHTVRQREMVAGRSDRWLVENRGKHLLRANPQDIAALLQGTVHNPRTRNRMLSDLRSFYRWAISDGHRKTDPTAGLERVRGGRYLPRPISKKEVGELFAASGRLDRPRAGVMIALMAYAGLRISEVVGLQRGDVDLELGRLRVFGKGSKERMVPISPRLAEILQGFIEDTNPTGYLFPSHYAGGRYPHVVPMTAWREVKSCARVANVEVTPHRLRHTFATEVLRGGADIRHVQALLGHSSLVSTQIYTQVTVDDLEQDVQRLDFS